MTHLPACLFRLFRLLAELGNAEGRRRVKGGRPSALGEYLETRQLLAADLTRMLYDATLLDQHGSATTVDSYFVAFNRSVSAATIKNVTGASAVQAFPLIPNSFNLTFDTSMSFQQAADSFSAISGFKYLYPNLPLERTVKFVPNDPLFVTQWHLQNTGQTGGTIGSDANITGAWDTHTGAGVVIGVVDDGVQLSHPDLAANVAAGLSFDYVDGDADPTPAANSFDAHGTAVAGVAAGVGNNALGITGAAYEASIAGIRLLGFPQTAATESAALTHRTQSVHIYNNSWGPVDFPVIAALPPQVEAALSAGTRLGRGGLGSIYTWAGGNGRGNGDYSNYDQYASSRHVIAVGAITHDGLLSSYSESGSNLLVSAYSSSPGIVTTDLVGADGYDSTDYTNDFGGTSSATPLVSGVIALMLEANPNLSYRDVMDVLVRNSERNDPTDSGWSLNGAGLWVNHKYGFGAIDAQAAVTASLTHNPMGPLVSQSTPVVRFNQTIADNTPTGVVASVTTNVQLNLEHVELVLNATHQRRGDLAVTLVSPNGTRSVMAQARTQDTGNDYTNWVFTTTRNWGERSTGTWTVEVSDRLSGTTGTLDDVQLRFYGTAVPLSLNISPDSFLENAGAGAATGTVSRSSTSSLAQPLVVTLTSNDTSEATVPATVTIPAGATSVTFPIRAIDDTLADGTQRIDIQASATIGGTLNTISAAVNVLDHETLSLAINPSTVLENAGDGAVRVTITRSNTDVGLPNTFSVVNNRLLEHSAAGTLVRSRTIPWPTGARPAGEIARDLVVMENGRVAVYNGTTIGYLSVLNQATNGWEHILVPGLSSNSTVAGSGGISSTGDFVFLSDMSTTSSDPFGVVRVNTTTRDITRFANQTLAYRMFKIVQAPRIFEYKIVEMDLNTGDTINEFIAPTDTSFGPGLAFDGTNVWVTGRYYEDTNDPLFTPYFSVYKLDASDGSVLEKHLVKAGSLSFEYGGLAWLNGQLYLTGFDNLRNSTLVAYDPMQGQITKTVNLTKINGQSGNIWYGLSGIKGPDRLIALSYWTNSVVEFNPSTGVIVNQWPIANDFFAYSRQGVATANGEIYVGGTTLDGEAIGVYNRLGISSRIISLDFGSPFTWELGGDDVQSLIPTDYRYRDIYSGLDDRFYALDEDGVAVGRFNSTTLALEEFFNLSRPVNAIAVAADGTIWGAGGDGILYHFSATGTVIGQSTIGSIALVDIDLSVNGEIVLTSTGGRVYRTNTSLATPTSYSAGTTVAYASLGRHQSIPVGDTLVQLTNSDPTAIRLPSSVVIPVGQRSVTVLADVIDDNKVDGTQISTVTATAVGYIGTQTGTVTVLDAEFVGVDIVASSISESAGLNATTARVYRTDIDGPFNFVSRQSFSNISRRDILDADKTTSTITVPRQKSLVTDVNVTLSLTHGFLEDLDIFLVSPSGTRVELVTDLVSNGTEMTATVFDDRAQSGILSGMVPYTGSFLPEGDLQDLNDENPTGTWTLEITDDNNVHFGTLISWRLDIETIGLGALIVALNPTGDPGEIASEQFVTIPANQSELIIPIDAIDDDILDGRQVAGLMPWTSATGFLYKSDSVNVLDQEELTFTVDRLRVTENAGSGALTGTLTRRNSDRRASFTVALSSSDTSELTVQSSVTFLPGQSTVQFPINAVDDNLLDGTQTVRIIATAEAYGSPKSVTISVDDLEPSLLVSGASTWVRENAGVFAVTVTRQDQTNIGSPMVVNLSVTNVSSGDAPLTVPASVTIAANQVSTTFNVTVNDDNLLDGTQRATIRATSAGVIAGSSVFSVTDYESLSVTFNSTSIREDNGANAAVGTVTRSNTDIASPLVVTLTSGDVSELTVPATVTIPAGALSANFPVNAVNDPILDGTQSVLVTASAAGYYSGTGTMNVLDHEPPVLTAPTATTTNPLPVIRWNPITNALRYDVLLDNLTTGIQQLYPDIIGSSFTPPERLGIDRYRVTVRAIDQLERDGFWSEPRDFVVNTAPVFTAPLSAGSAANGTFPEIAWTAVIDAAGYQLTVNNLTTGRRNVISQLNLATTSYRSTEGLGSGVYSATVRAFNSAREFRLWSTTIQFTVLAAPAVVTPVIGGTFDRTPALTWTAVSGAINYDVMLTNTVTKAVVYRDRYVTGLSYLVPRDLADATYEVTVRAQNGAYFSAWSAPRVFSVGAPPTITTLGNTTTVGSRPQFVWTGISGTERYEIWVRNVDTGVDAFKVDNITETTFTAQIHLPLAKYRVYVRAISTLGEITEWSEPVEFISGGVANVTSPTANATTVSRPIISWSSVTGAVGYVVQIRNLDTNTVTLTTAPQPGNSYVLTTALPSGRYRVWVQAVSAAGYRSNWGASVDFFVTESAQKKSVPQNDSDDLLASVQSLLTPPVAPSAAIPVARIQVTAAASLSAASRSNENVLEENQTMVESAEHLIAAATGIEAIHDAVMSGWDASEWWTARS